MQGMIHSSSLKLLSDCKWRRYVRFSRLKSKQFSQFPGNFSVTGNLEENGRISLKNYLK